MKTHALLLLPILASGTNAANFCRKEEAYDCRCRGLEVVRIHLIVFQSNENRYESVANKCLYLSSNNAKNISSLSTGPGQKSTPALRGRCAIVILVCASGLLPHLHLPKSEVGGEWGSEEDG
jgi:hypothetical protein